MTHPYAKQLTKALKVMKQANDAVNAILDDAELLSIKTVVEAHQVKAINYLAILMGDNGQLTAAENVPQYGPVTHFFGKPIEVRPLVTPKDLTPKDNEREQFFQQRDDLYNEFPTLTNDELMARCSQPGAENVIRAVAKKAGVEGYKTAEIDVLFLDSIREAVEAQMEETKLLAEAEAKLNK